MSFIKNFLPEVFKKEREITSEDIRKRYYPNVLTNMAFILDNLENIIPNFKRDEKVYIVDELKIDEFYNSENIKQFFKVNPELYSDFNTFKGTIGDVFYLLNNFQAGLNISLPDFKDLVHSEIGFWSENQGYVYLDVLATKGLSEAFVIPNADVNGNYPNNVLPKKIVNVDTDKDKASYIVNKKILRDTIDKSPSFNPFDTVSGTVDVDSVAFRKDTKDANNNKTGEYGIKLELGSIAKLKELINDRLMACIEFTGQINSPICKDVIELMIDEQPKIEGDLKISLADFIWGVQRGQDVNNRPVYHNPYRFFGDGISVEGSDVFLVSLEEDADFQDNRDILVGKYIYEGVRLGN